MFIRSERTSILNPLHFLYFVLLNQPSFLLRLLINNQGGSYDLHIKVYLHPILPNEIFFPLFHIIKIRYRKPKYAEQCL